ncbi:MAG: Fe-S cluster assembly protein SufD [Chloroflexaceae bacterium]|nr:Fe-S cluster assembly protein SufD [Chloroflexaceae bacterium]
MDTHLNHPFPPLQALTSAHLEAAARANGEPEWLVQRRKDAWECFSHAAPPEWRRTNLKGLEPETIEPFAAPQGTGILWDETLAERGIIFSSLTAAVRSHESQVRATLGTAIDPLRHKFSALRAALWQDGIFLFVPDNVSLDIPLRVCYILADGSRAIFPYSLVVLGRGAKVAFIEEFTSHDAPAPALAAPTTEIFLGEGSSLQFASIQQWGANVYHIGGQSQVFDRDATSTWVSIALGGQVQHIEAEAHLRGAGSSLTWHGATFARKQQRLLTAPLLRHTGVHTESHLDFRTIVHESGYSVFDGMITIEHASRGTVTRLEEHSIHLSPGARSDSIPGLKIDTNDVAQAGHASTSGQIDEEQLFYMQSRGISRADAMRMIVTGFFEPVFDALPLEEVRESLSAAVEANL